MDLATVDHLLTTTRSVRKRLDLERPVPRELVDACIKIALQAPTGSNMQGWSFIVVTDAAKRRALADIYRKGWALYGGNPDLRPTYAADDPRTTQMPRIYDSAGYLAEHLHEVPVHVIPCIEGRIENGGVLGQASVYGSTLHLMFEQEAAQVLGIPETVTQTALLPVAYFRGTDFKPARRIAPERLIHWDTWGAHKR
jgi:nitroreductase